MEWFSVRCLFRFGTGTYEERITLWHTTSFAEAVTLAETEAADYAATVDCEYLGFAQVYAVVDPPAHGAEVFSLLRDSTLAPDTYLDAFFDTGGERQGVAGSP